MFLQGTGWLHILTVTDVLSGTVWLHILTVTDVFIGDCLITYINSNWCFYRGLFDYIY